MYCRRCGRPVKDNELFCKNCGTKLRDETELHMMPERTKKKKGRGLHSCISVTWITVRCCGCDWSKVERFKITTRS